MRKSLIFTLQYHHKLLILSGGESAYMQVYSQSKQERDCGLRKSKPRKSKEWKSAKYRTVERGTLEEGSPAGISFESHKKSKVKVERK